MDYEISLYTQILEIGGSSILNTNHMKTGISYLGKQTDDNMFLVNCAGANSFDVVVKSKYPSTVLNNGDI